MSINEKYKEQFGDLWFRARHNALANMEAATEAKRKVKKYEKKTAIFIVLPIFGITLAQQFTGIAIAISIISALCSVLALYYTLVGSVQENKYNYFYHSRAHSIFNNIAQKARRGSSPSLEEGELKYLLRSLEEMFETAKQNMQEPSDSNYDEGLRRMNNMPKWPFDLKKTTDG